ncbi:right-handed parallel beta-helix repeat-containing protein, partial [Methanobrevibacter smithii]|uniref:right-handed parallel beta-helix repeat-containing protein n=2 Tax=Methanobacteriaceae TaxID=2159 RepID=UPI00384B57DF
MKINNKILVSLLIVLIAAISLSAVSAAEDVDTNAVSAPAEVEALEISSIDMSGVISEPAAPAANNTVWNVNSTATAADVQKIIDNSKSGDTINFTKDAVYNWHSANKSEVLNAITIPHALIIEGNNATIDCDNGFTADSKLTSIDGTTFQNINFNINQKNKINGRGIELININNVKIINCSFENGHSGIYTGTCSNITVIGCSFMGTTDIKTIGKKEKGTKGINIMGGSNHILINNYFGKDLLDGVSIASGAQNNFQFINNTFVNNWYGVFYGGGVRGVVVEGNTFINNKIYDLGLVKAAGETKINNNTFISGYYSVKVDENTTLSGTCTPIYIEQGNTAHGAPSTIETITITNNIFEAYNDTNPYTIDAVYVQSKGGPLLPIGTITVTNNTYEEGITPVTFMDNSWKGENNTYIIGPATLDTLVKAPTTAITVGDSITMQLATKNGITIPNAKVTITAKNGNMNKTIEATTDAFGLFTVEGLGNGNWTLDIAYAGTTTSTNGYLYGASKTTIKATVAGKTTLTIKNTTIIKGGKLIYTLTDANGKPIENVTVTLNINGRDYTKITNENGTVSMGINLQPKDYLVTATCKVGNDTITSKDVITVTSNIITKDITLYYKNGTSFEATILDANGKAVGKGINVTFNINGVFYT